MSNNVEHLEEQVELYALGMLERGERARVDAHVRACTECSERLGRAEITVAAMVDASLPGAVAPPVMIDRLALAREPGASNGPWRRATFWATAAAAAFAIASGTLAHQNSVLLADVDSDGAAFRAMIHSHFLHAQFVSLEGTPIDAKVIYERHGDWYDVLANGIDPNVRIAVRRGDGETVLPNRFARRGDVLTLALPALGAVTDMRLLDAQGRTIGHVRPAVAAEK